MKADPSDWMRRYFDAVAVAVAVAGTASWCGCPLALRVPPSTFRGADLKLFAARHVLIIETDLGGTGDRDRAARVTQPSGLSACTQVRSFDGAAPGDGAAVARARRSDAISATMTPR
ncbi:hypothetical protein [Variovorax sp. YR566]|uniref:hypothetical protein n=1 Tax=Variovorax sp. YR566 TaxID=3450237 RepID=UPI003F7D8AD6